ncbi:MAG: hypothetical protein PHX08_03730 [Lachnospiraceae bacterium]|nr:hypothetical protein [Lachnospiraceae bacterium]
MILNTDIINRIKELSHLNFEQTKDFETLSHIVTSATGRSMGVTTLKRLMGYIHDERKTNKYTLNTLAIYLGAKSWENYIESNNIDSEWQFNDDTIYVNSLQIGTNLLVKYLDREISLKVYLYEQKKTLLVTSVKNSSLKVDDILFIDQLKKGNQIMASKVVRGKDIGNYKTKGEITDIVLI